jgi:hypothetical protein
MSPNYPETAILGGVCFDHPPVTIISFRFLRNHKMFIRTYFEIWEAKRIPNAEIGEVSK